MTQQNKLKCAVYTRKSTEEGLDQNYNSLDAQRDAGEAYIKSQQHEGWSLISTRYDDGGFSGGNIQRPGLKALLQDIRAGKINVVVVYKIDRLTRSLMDFSKLVEVFDQHGVTFVSVTQNFNTVSSMGRLTLNVLLSFAQFEREVTGERIRDKFASSKKKGIWMGGRLALGYDLGDRKLIINEEEADRVRWVFKQYLELNSIYDLLASMCRKGIKTKSWTTGAGHKREGSLYTTSTIYTMLRNPLYVGKLKHKGAIYNGEHSAIVDPETWGKVQKKLDGRTRERSEGKYKLKPFLLRGKIFDGDGNRLNTTYSTKVYKEKKTFIRYYIDIKSARRGYTKSSLRTINADEVEGVAETLLRTLFKDQPLLQRHWTSIIPAQKEKLFSACLKRFEISASRIRVTFDTTAVAGVQQRYKAQEIGFESGEERSRGFNNIENLTVEFQGNETICYMPYFYKRYGGKRVITNTSGQEVKVAQSTKNIGMITALTTAGRCHKMLETGACHSIAGLARHFGRDRSYISKIMKLDYLSPRIKGVILDGQQPGTLTLQSLLNLADQVDWKKQEAQIGLNFAIQ